MANWEKIAGTIANIFKAGSQVYATTVVAQAQVGMFDTQTKSLNTQISILKDTELAKKETAENTQKANQIKNKIMYYQYITEDEYDFLVGLGYDIGMSYEQYIDFISNPQKYQSNTVQKQETSNIKPYLLLLGLAGTYLILKKR